MKFGFELSKLALKDLEQIWLYIFEKWSKTQAIKYYKELIRGVDTICKNPIIGKSISEVKLDHRLLKIKSHLIIYKVIEEKVFIDRILHERMDVDYVLLE